MSTKTNKPATTETEERLSMYKFAHLVSETVGRRVREQQLYQYRAKGMIKLDGKSIVGEDGKVAKKDAEAWAKQFAGKQTERAAKREAKLAAEQTA